jgi:hypothetical protein
VLFDDTLSTVSYTEKCEVPPNWADLVKKSTEKVTDVDYDLASLRLFQMQKTETLQYRKQTIIIEDPLVAKIPATLFQQEPLVAIIPAMLL